MTLPWLLAGAAAGLVAGPRIRASVFCRQHPTGWPPRRACPASAHEILPDRWRWRSRLAVTRAVRPAASGSGRIRCLQSSWKGSPWPLAMIAKGSVDIRVTSSRSWQLSGLPE